MPEFVMKPETFIADQFDGKNLIDGMSADMGGAFVIDQFDNLIYIDPGDWVVKNNFGSTSVYKDAEFKKRFAPAE